MVGRFRRVCRVSKVGRGRRGSRVRCFDALQG